MKKTISILVSSFAIALIVFGSIGFFNNLIQAVRYDNIGYNKYFEQKPLHGQEGFAIDSKGNIYLGTMEFSGIQVYDMNGDFLYGMSFPTGWGGYFDYFIDDKDYLHVLIYRSLEEYIIHNGEIYDKIKDVNLEVRTGEYEAKKSNALSENGMTYKKESSHVIEIYEGTELINRLVLDSPKWPLSATTFFFINALGFFILAVLHRNLFKQLKSFKR